MPESDTLCILEREASAVASGRARDDLDRTIGTKKKVKEPDGLTMFLASSSPWASGLCHQISFTVERTPHIKLFSRQTLCLTVNNDCSSLQLMLLLYIYIVCVLC